MDPVSSATERRSDVPPYLHLTPPLTTTDFKKVPLTPLIIQRSTPRVVPCDYNLPSKEVLYKHTGHFGSIVFVVRRPGCVLCREEGLSLTAAMLSSTMQLDPDCEKSKETHAIIRGGVDDEEKKLDPTATFEVDGNELKMMDLFEGFGIFAVVKEVEDQEGLEEFFSIYFPHPVYLDKDLNFYKALGMRKVKLNTWNPVKWHQWFSSTSKRHEKKGISGNFKGEAWIQGGIILFDRDGNQRFAYQERTGFQAPIEDLIEAMKEIATETIHSCVVNSRNSGRGISVQELDFAGDRSRRRSGFSEENGPWLGT